MTDATSMQLADAPLVTAPDGAAVRVLLATGRGSMAHFSLGAGRVSRAVAHRTVEEIWFIIAGSGEMWRRSDEIASVIDLVPGVCLTIPCGTAFQFRSHGHDPLEAVAVTMPPWPGAEEAYFVDGCWASTEGEGDVTEWQTT